MGNRAVIGFGDGPKDLGIYLHWNGGRDSVEGFLAAGRQLMGDRLGDGSYCAARLVQVIGNFLGGTTSLGLGTIDQLDADNGDNGLYIVDPDTLKITGRKYHSGEEQNEYKLDALVADIVAKNAMFNK